MANNHRGEVDAEILGKHYTLKLTTNAIAEMQQALPGMVVGRDHPLQFGFPGVRAMLFAALLHDRRQRLTLDQAGDLLDDVLHDGGPEGYNTVTEALTKALRLFFDPNDTGEAKPAEDEPKN